MRAILVLLFLTIIADLRGQFNGVVAMKSGPGQSSYFLAIEEVHEEFDTICVIDSTYGFSHDHTYDKKNNRYFRRTNKGISVLDASNGSVIKHIDLKYELRGIEYDQNADRLYGTYEYWGWDIFSYIDVKTDSLIQIDSLWGVNLYSGFGHAMDDQDGIWYRSVSNRLYGLDVQNGNILINQIMPGMMIGLEYDPSNGLLYFLTNHGQFVMLRSYSPILNRLMSRDSFPTFIVSSHASTTLDYINRKYYFSTGLGIMIIDMNRSVIIDTLKLSPSFKDYEFAPVCPSTCEPIHQVICEGDSVFLEGAFRTSSGLYRDSAKNKYGCYGLYFTDLLINSAEVDVQVDDSGLHVADSGMYQWIDCSNGAFLNGETNQSFYPSSPGWYSVIVDDGNCVDTSDCIAYEVSGLGEWGQNNLSIYPNPMSNRLHIEYPGMNEQGVISIYQSNGELVLRKNAIKKIEDLDVSSLDPGIYLLNYTAGDRRITRKVIKSDQGF